MRDYSQAISTWEKNISRSYSCSNPPPSFPTPDFASERKGGARAAGGSLNLFPRDKRELLRGILGLARCYKRLGQAAHYVDLMKKALSEARKLEDLREQQHIAMGIANHYYETQSFAMAIQYWEMCLKLSVQLGDLESNAQILTILGDLHLRLGDDSQAMQYQKEAMKLLSVG